MSIEAEGRAPEPQPEQPDVLGRVLAVVGLLAHGVVGLIFFVAAGLIAPLYGIIFLAIGWSLLLLLAIKWWTPRPRMIIIIPFAAFAFWTAVVWAGGEFLGWQA